jgi:hypothetical protein
MTKKQLKNLLRPVPYQIPLLVLLAEAVHYLTGLGLWWCVPIAVVLTVMYIDALKVLLKND